MFKRQISVLSTVLISIFILICRAESQSHLSSLYHDTELDWQTVTTEHFWIHFPSGFEELGFRVGTICEHVYESVSSSLNYYPDKTHVVVHTRVDIPEGLVSFMPWRMELFVTEPQGNIMGSGDEWLHILITHEFTHIVHLRKRKLLSALTYPFLGDFNSVWQLIIPKWFTEGIATLNETRYSSGGRGRTPFHWMQMAEPIQSGRPWRLENTSYESRKRLPQARMSYVSGYYLSHFVVQRYGPHVWAKILDRYTAFPILGFGRAVKSVTGESLKQLYDTMLAEFDTSFTNLGSLAHPIQVWRKTKRPENQHSPRWVDQNHLMIYRVGFDDLQELAVIDRTGRVQRIRQRKLAKRDNSFTFGEEVLVWAELHSNPLFSATIYSDLVFYDRDSGESHVLTDNDRVYSPDLSPNETRIVAVQTALPTTRLVTVNLETGQIQPVLEIPKATLLNPQWSPDGERIAFALKDSTGRQDIAILDVQTGHWRQLYTSDIYHDNNPCWTPDSRFVLYTSDRSGTFNIWAVEINTGNRWMVTDLGLGAFTPDVSPSGDELAFTIYTHTGFAAATMLLDSTRWIKGANVERRVSPAIFETNYPVEPISGALSGSFLPPTPYQPWSQILRPQGWFPYLFEDNNKVAVALFAASQDALHRHSWRGYFALSPQHRRPSVDFRYDYSGLWPRFGVRNYSVPQQVSYQGETGWWRKDGIDLAILFPLILESNLYTTFFQPIFGVKRQTRTNVTGRIRPELQDYHGVQLGFHLARTGQAPRDIVPHRALFITAFADWSHRILGSQFHGRQYSSQVRLFLPTPISHHQLELLGKYQNRRGNFDYGFFDALPIGYDDDHRGHQIRLRLAYILPLAYAELPIPFLPIFVDYLDAAVFYDWGTSWDKDFNPLAERRGENGRYSAGLQVTSVNFIFQRFRMRLGAAIFYHSDERTWRTVPVIELPF